MFDSKQRLDELKALFPDLANKALDLFDEMTEELD